MIILDNLELKFAKSTTNLVKDFNLKEDKKQYLRKHGKIGDKKESKFENDVRRFGFGLTKIKSNRLSSFLNDHNDFFLLKI